MKIWYTDEKSHTMLILVITEMQIKTTIIYQNAPSRMAKWKDWQYLY